MYSQYPQEESSWEERKVKRFSITLVTTNLTTWLPRVLNYLYDSSSCFSLCLFTLRPMTGETTQQTKFLKGLLGLVCPQPRPQYTSSILGKPWGQFPSSSLFSATRQAAQLVLATKPLSWRQRPVTWRSETWRGYFVVKANKDLEWIKLIVKTTIFIYMK